MLLDESALNRLLPVGVPGCSRRLESPRNAPVKYAPYSPAYTTHSVNTTRPVLTATCHCVPSECFTCMMAIVKLVESVSAIQMRLNWRVCRLHPSDWALRWRSEQEAGALAPFEVLGGQLWGSRLSVFNSCGERGEPFCDHQLAVVLVFGTVQVLHCPAVSGIMHQGCMPKALKG